MKIWRKRGDCATSTATGRRIGDGQGAEDQADEAVGGHEGDVDFGDVFGRLTSDCSMTRSRAAKAEADPIEDVELPGDADEREGANGESVTGARDEEGFASSNFGGDGIELHAAVEFFILQGVEDVEAGDPEEDTGAQQEDGEAAPDRTGRRRAGRWRSRQQMGASPSDMPSQKWHNAVNRFVSE